MFPAPWKPARRKNKVFTQRKAEKLKSELWQHASQPCLLSYAFLLFLQMCYLHDSLFTHKLDETGFFGHLYQVIQKVIEKPFELVPDAVLWGREHLPLPFKSLLTSLNTELT